MQRRLLLLLTAVFIVTSLGINVRRANAVVASITVNAACSSVTVTGTGIFPIPSFVQVFVGGTLIGAGSSPGLFYTITVNFPPQAPGTVLEVRVTDPSLSITSIPCGASASGSTTFFDPNDGRADPRPGDRLAIWCNTTATTPNLLIYGVNADSKGIFLATINFADILKAGNPNLRALKLKLQQALDPNNSSTDTQIADLVAQIDRAAKTNVLTRNIGRNGTLTIAVDTDNNFWISWTGGPYGANGQGSWAKGFKCDFKR